MSFNWIMPIGLVCALAIAGADATADEHVRRYGDGVLTPKDFQAEIPSSRDGLDAVVHTRLHYDYAFLYREVKGTFWVRCKAVRCSAEILPKKSWLRVTQSPELVDHEQGHFDLAEIAARHGQKHLNELIKKRKLRSKGETLEEAQKALDERIEYVLAKYDEELSKANELYDEETDHGRRPREQRDARKAHKQMLQDLASVRKRDGDKKNEK